ncbi:MAG: glucokinase [Deltaproteobacteria bacterium]|nr:glucokinase [Deltaproteobacteria bacterium]
MILAGDTGGTKTVLALCDLEGRIVHERIFLAADYASLEAIVAVFLAAHPAELVGACFGVAGPVVDGTARITNLPWVIDAKALSAQLGVPVTLLNDLQATALGALVLPPEAFAWLQPQATPAPTGTIAVIAPGTGLGESLVIHDGAGFRALPSEGGHADFAPGNERELELWRYLRARHGDHVSYERVLSGNGLGDLYGFCRSTRGAEPAWLTAALAAGDRNAVVAETALAGGDSACAEALAMFVEILGAEGGILALRGLATGGVVIGGGIPPKIVPALQTGALVARFNAKGRFSAWTRALGVRVTLEPRAALFGAAHHVLAHKDRS